MAPKHSHLEDPPAASSSDDEEVSSSDEETDLDEEKKENLTSDEEEDEEEETDDVPMAQPEKAKTDPIVEESETESDSDSESEQAKPKKDDVVKSTKPKLGSPVSEKMKQGVVALPAKPAAKRPATKTESNGKEAKRAKTTEPGKKPNEEDGKRTGEDTARKNLFQRLFSEDDEIALLQGMVEFNENRGDPYEDMDGFCDFIKKSLNCEASKVQLVDKLRRLKKKYENSLKRGKKGEEKVYSKAHDQKALSLSKKIWGGEGALQSVSKSAKSKKNLGSTKKGLAIVKTDLFSSPEKEGKVNASGNNFEIMHCTNSEMSGKDVAAFFKRTNLAGLNETMVAHGWDMIDGTSKKELGEKLKKLEAAEMEVFLQRNELIGEISKELWKKRKASV